MGKRDIIRFINLKVDLVESEEVSHLTFIGDIGENFRQRDIPRLKSLALHLHLKDVRHFTSSGVRQWIEMIKEISSSSLVWLHGCSVSFVDQINLMPHSLGPVCIRSFYAPYYCSCGNEKLMLIDVMTSSQLLIKPEAPTFNCEGGQEMLFDALEETYFRFLAFVSEEI